MAELWSLWITTTDVTACCVPLSVWDRLYLRRAEEVNGEKCNRWRAAGGATGASVLLLGDVSLAVESNCLTMVN